MHRLFINPIRSFTSNFDKSEGRYDGITNIAKQSYKRGYYVRNVGWSQYVVPIILIKLNKEYKFKKDII